MNFFFWLATNIHGSKSKGGRSKVCPLQGLNGEPVKLGADQKVTVEEAPSCAAGEDEEWWIHMKKRETVGIQHTRFNVSPPVEE